MISLQQGFKASLHRAVMPLVVIAVLAIALVPVSLAQAFSSSISGVVTDPSAAVVTGATVKLINIATNDTRQTVTDQAGAYQFANLLPGTYEITAEASGFRTFVQTNLILQANTAAAVNISLDLGATQQRVEVTGSAVLVDSETATHSVTLESRMIEALPNNTRNPLNFVFALAGTTEAQGGMTSRSNTFDQMFSMFGLSGGRVGNEQILVDGAPSTAPDWGGLMVSPLNDSVQEQQILQNTYDAQYERSGAGIVTLITKSGSNAFHGEGFNFVRNSALDANTWAANRNGQPKGEFERYQFGGNFGGPILKRYNLFFFGGYEGLRQPETDVSGLQTVPTALQRGGDFSQTFNAEGAPVTIYNPFSTHQVTGADGKQYYTRDAFSGNKIPANMMNAVGQKIANLYPAPNRPGQGPNQINNYYLQRPGTTLSDKMDARIDWNQNDKHRMFGRYTGRIRQNWDPACFYCNGADSGYAEADNGLQAVVNDTFTPSPSWVVNSFIAYSRWSESHTAPGYGKSSPGSLGLNASDFQAPILPVFYADNYAQLGSWAGYQNYVRYSDTAQVNVTRQFSRHTVKFGGNFTVQMINNIQSSPGTFNFSSSLTSCDPVAGGACQALNYGSNVTGNAVASMLLGAGSGGNSPLRPAPAMSMHTFGGYVQDQWRVTPRLTVNAGLRYENQRPATERFNRLAYFNMNVVNPISAQAAPILGRQVLGGFQFASSSNRGAWPEDNLNFAPRLGIAYKITDKLVARAGLGIFHLPASAMLSFDGDQYLGFNSYTNYIGTVGGQGYIPQNLISNPFPQGIVQPYGSSKGLNTQVGQSASQIWLTAPHPVGYTLQWSFDVQYQLSPHSVVEAGYTGVRGRKLMYGNPNININQLPTQFLGLGDRLDEQVPNPFQGIITDPNSGLSGPTVAYNQLLRPFPEFGYLGITRSLPGATSAFDALNLKYNYTFHSGFSLLMTYQWSKAMDNGPEDMIGWSTGNSWRDSYNTRLDYNVSTHDVPHSFVSALVYEVPFGKGRRFGNSLPFLANQAFGNWELSSTIRFASGMPLFQVYDNDWAYRLGSYGFPGPEIPDMVGNPKPANQNASGWINPAAFKSTSGLLRYGNAPQRTSLLREATTKNFDFAVAKNFGTERFKVQVRGEFLNAFNHPVFGGNYNISRCIDCGDVGMVYGTRNDPRNIQLALKAIF